MPSSLSEILNRRPGIDALTNLAAIDPFTLELSERIDYLAALEKQSGWLQALLQNAIVAVAGAKASRGADPVTGIDEAEREEVATALRMSGSNAQIKIDLARVLTQNLPLTTGALACGEISINHANAIARESAEIIKNGATLDQLREIETMAIAHSEFHTPTQVASKIKSAIAKIAPQEFERAVTQAMDRRSVECYPQPDGMAQIVALLPAVDAHIVMLAIDKLARSNRELQSAKARLHERQKERRKGLDKTDRLGDGVSRSESDSDLKRMHIDRESIALQLRIEALRADALTQIANNHLGSTRAEGYSHGRPIAIQLSMDLPTMLGLAENPAILKGYGPIPPNLARELAADAHWRKFITDPVSGELLDVGRSTYNPPQVLKDFLTARDQVCRFPRCRQPARVSDMDHAQAWGDGGRTSKQNMGMLCRRHHRLKTHGGW